MTAELNQFVTRHLSGGAWTNRTVTQLSYKWRIPCFWLCDSDNVIESPKFSTDSNEKQWWWIRLQLTKPLFCIVTERKPYGDGMRYSLELCSSPKLNSGPSSAPSTIKFKCSVINCKGKEEYVMSNEHDSNNLSISNPLFTEADLFREKDKLLPHGALTILCEIHLIGPSSNVTADLSDFDADGPELPEDFKKLFSSEEHSDFTIVVGDKKFNVHKPVLAARSTVFSAMFKHGMEESKNNEVVITDITSEIFEKMLFFIYTNEIPKDYDQIGICMDLLIAADKYALNKLKKLCEKAVYGKITIENAAEMLQFADLHQAKQLSEHVQDFFCRHSKEIMDTPDFKSLEDLHPRLVSSLLRKMSSLVSVNLGSDGPMVKRQKKA